MRVKDCVTMAQSKTPAVKYGRGCSAVDVARRGGIIPGVAPKTRHGTKLLGDTRRKTKL